MLIAIVLSCSIAATTDVLGDFDRWIASRPDGMLDPVARGGWIDRFIAADPRTLPARGLERLGDLYMSDGEPFDAITAYRAACSASGGASVHAAAKLGFAALEAGSPRDAADAVRFFEAAGGNHAPGGPDDPAGTLVSQFREASGTLAIDAAIRGLREGTVGTREYADAAIAEWNEALAGGRMDPRSAADRLAALVGGLHAWGTEPPEALVPFDPLSLAKAAVALGSIDPGSDVGVGAMAGAIRAASLGGDAATILDVATLAAATAGPAQNNAMLNELRAAAARATSADGDSSGRLERRLLELAIASEERLHPNDFGRMYNWQLSLLQLANRCVADGDAAGAQVAIGRLRAQGVDGVVASMLAEAEANLSDLLVDQPPVRIPEEKAAAPAERAAHGQPDDGREPAPADAPARGDAPPPTAARAAAPADPTPAAEGGATRPRGIGIPILAVLTALALGVAWRWRPGPGAIGP